MINLSWQVNTNEKGSQNQRIDLYNHVVVGKTITERKLRKEKAHFYLNMWDTVIHCSIGWWKVSSHSEKQVICKREALPQNT